MISSAWTSRNRSPTLTASCSRRLLAVADQLDDLLELVVQRAPRSATDAACAPARTAVLEARRLDRLQQVVDGVDLERLDRVLVERRDEDDLRLGAGARAAGAPPRSRSARASARRGTRGRAAVARSTSQRLEAVAGLADDLDAVRSARAGSTARRAPAARRRRRARAGACGHAATHAVTSLGTTSSGISMRAHVPSPGALSSLQLVVRAVDHAQPLVHVAQADAAAQSASRSRSLGHPERRRRATSMIAWPSRRGRCGS